MTETNVFKRLGEYRLLPVVVTGTGRAVEIARALREGGINAAEITFRESGAETAIEEIKRAFPDMLVGAGTILSVAQADAAVASGADFIVSPGLNPAVVRHCREQNVTVIPGCMTPGEIELALSLGLSCVKFFPAELAGGAAMVHALAQPYCGVKFLPTGGISLENLADYLVCPSVLACGGSFMVREDFIRRGDFQIITETTEKAVDLIKTHTIKFKTEA